MACKQLYQTNDVLGGVFMMKVRIPGGAFMLVVRNPGAALRAVLMRRYLCYDQ